MNYLQICNDLHEKTGESGADLTTVSNLSGYQKRIANLVKDAWEEIQSLHTTWRFMRHEALPTIAADAQVIDADDWVCANLSLNIDSYHKNTFSIYLTATGISDETTLTYVPWERWKEYFGIQFDDGATNRPTHITIDPSDDTLLVGPVSNGAYTVSFAFNQVPVVFSSNSQEPNIVKSLHKIIVWRALEMYGYHEESKHDIARGHKNYMKFLRRLQKRELPEITVGEPLA